MLKSCKERLKEMFGIIPVLTTWAWDLRKGFTYMFFITVIKERIDLS
jgi:hypothetical protein